MHELLTYNCCSILIKMKIVKSSLGGQEHENVEVFDIDEEIVVFVEGLDVSVIGDAEKVVDVDV